ncbi:MAG: NAD(P)H-binding protein, partial [Mycobacterium sp.]
AGGAAVRVIARDAGKLDPGMHERLEIIEGSHSDPAVLDRALPGADALFWLVPPNTAASSAKAHYLAFARVAADAIRRHRVSHVVGVSTAGHGWPKSAGLSSASLVMDAELERSGAAYGALGMPFYMDNLERQLDAIRQHGVFSLTYAPDRPLAMVATRDIAQVAAGLLTNRDWTGQQRLPVFGPDRLTPEQMSTVMTDVLARPVTYRQTSIEDFASGLVAQGWTEQAVRDMTEMLIAQDEGMYEADWAAATPTTTDFRTWLENAVQSADRRQDLSR